MKLLKRLRAYRDCSSRRYSSQLTHWRTNSRSNRSSCNNHVAHGEQDRRLAAGPGRNPIIRLRSSVGQPRVDDADFRAALFAFDDSLGVGIEIMAGFQVRAQQQHKARIGVIGRGTVDARPESVTRARARGADVGVAVVAVDAPGVKNSLVIEQLMSRPADVIHDLIAAIFLERFAYARRNVVEHFIPSNALPFAFAAFADAFERIANAFRVGDLIERRRPLGAVAASAAGMLRIALEAADSVGVFLDDRHQAAAGFAVKTNRRNDPAMLLYFPRPLAVSYSTQSSHFSTGG